MKRPVVVLAAPALSAVLLLLAGCAEDQSAQPRQQPQPYDWRGKRTSVDGSYEHSVDIQPPKNHASGQSPASSPAAPGKGPKLADAILPSQAVTLLGQYLAAADPDKMYDEFLASNQQKLLTKEEFKKRIQDNYYRILQLTLLLNQEEPRYVQQGRSADRRQCSFTLHWARRPKPKNPGEECLWGVGFRWEKNCWKLEQFRPEILAPLDE